LKLSALRDAGLPGDIRSNKFSERFNRGNEWPWNLPHLPQAI
jgi:hypothetical protein